MNQFEQYNQAPAILAPITPQSFATVISVIMAVWMAAFVLQQIIKAFKGEVIEKPPLLSE